VTNRLERIVNTINHTPIPVRRQLLSRFVGFMVPFTGTSRLKVEEMTPAKVTVEVPNRRPVQNHIGSVHAVAMALAVETASGFVTGMNVPDSCLPLLKTLKIDYEKRCKGNIRAEATLTDEQRQTMKTNERGSVEVEVHAWDGTGNEPIRCLAQWAWIPKKKPSAQPTTQVPRPRRG
jgi:acyl-coenzyme A thioesterase PaaI-like protein